jgi:hypothetical protein
MWIVLGVFKKMPRNKILTKIVSTIVVVAYFLNSNFINIFVKYLDCIEYDGESYLANNLDQKCWDHDHSILTGIVTIPMIFLWMLLQPIFILFMLLKRKKLKSSNSQATQSIQNELLIVVVRFYTDGYREKLYLWEFILMAKKYLFILLPLIVPLNNIASVLTYVLIILSFLILHQELKPYKYPEMNQLQFLSIYSILTTYIFSIPNYFTQSISHHYLYVNIFFVLITNLFFFLYWIKCYYRFVVKDIIRDFGNKIRGPGNKKSQIKKMRNNLKFLFPRRTIVE